MKEYCNHCQKKTQHQVMKETRNKNGNIKDLRCKECSSSRLDKIQGFNAQLM